MNEQQDPTQPTQSQEPGPQTGQGQAGVPAAPAAGAVPVTDDARQWALFSHLSGISGFIGPLIIYLVKKDDHPFIADQSREALNFNITYGIAFSVCWLLAFVLIGFLLLPIVGIAWIVLLIIAATKANKGEAYRYPAIIRMVN